MRITPALRLIPCLLAWHSFGQEFQGTILGRVSDSTGAVVPDVRITATATDTNASTATRTNPQGNYRIPFLLPGNYRVMVDHAGFRRIEQRNIRVSTDTQVTLDFTIEVSASSESVTVTDSPTPLATNNADLGQVVDRAYIMNTPISLTRNVMNNLQLSAAVNGASGNTYTSNGQSGFAIAGGGATSGNNEIIVDGVPNTTARSGGVIVYVPTADSVDEMKVHTTMFDAAYGHSNGGAVSITTKGGTNNLHGTAYDFKKWAALNANSWSNNRLGLRKPPVGYNQFGGLFGGPVYIPKLYDGRNRTFFSVSYESDADKRDLFRQARVPTDLERNGDFSQTLNRRATGLLQIFDPTTTTGGAANVSRMPFPGARIPAARFNPTGAAVAKAFSTPNLGGTPQIGQFNWAASGITAIKQRNLSIRGDQIIGSKQRVFARYSRLKRIQDADTLIPGSNSFPNDGNSDIGQDDRYFNNFALDDTITLSPTLVASIRYGLSMRRSVKSNPRRLPDPSALNLPAAISQNQSFSGYPNFDLGESFATLGATKSTDNFYTSTWLATLYKQLGNHSLKFGGDFRLHRYNTVNPGSSGSGTFSFNSIFTQANPFVNTSADTSGTTLAALLLGMPNSGSLGYNTPLSMQNTYTGLYLQDEWKVRPRLTLNFGVRYELESPYTERYNRNTFGFDPNAPSPLKVPGLNLRGGVLFAGKDGNPRREGNMDTNNFGPRFGFAWSLNSKTVVRGGFGMFYSAQTYNTDFLGNIATFNAVTTYVGTTDSGATPFTTLANPFPAGIRLPEGSAAGLAARYGDSLTVYNQNRVNPYNEQWQIGFQRELPGRLLLEGAYMGMHSLKQLQAFNLNEKPDQYLALGVAENNRIPNPFLNIFSPQSSLGQGSTINQKQLWGLYPQYSSLSSEGQNTGQAIYHSAQMKVEKRYSHGLNMLVSYNFSKLIANNIASIINDRHYRSIDGSDRPEILRMAFVYELPFGPGKPVGSSLRGPLARIPEGWVLSSYINYRSGAPLSITQTNGRPIRLRNASKDGSISQRLGDQIDPKTRKPLNPYFDIDAFAALPNQFSVPPEPPFWPELRGPAAWGRNLAVSKNVRIYERIKMQIRAEATNFTNSVSWGNPGTNMSNLATFGVINSGGGGRSIQMGARIAF